MRQQAAREGKRQGVAQDCVLVLGGASWTGVQGGGSRTKHCDLTRQKSGFGEAATAGIWEKQMSTGVHLRLWLNSKLRMYTVSSHKINQRTATKTRLEDVWIRTNPGHWTEMPEKPSLRSKANWDLEKSSFDPPWQWIYTKATGIHEFNKVERHKINIQKAT